MNKQECIGHIQTVVNLLADLEAWERTSFVRAMAHGLHGEKRQDRFESGKDAGIIKFFQSETMDFFETEILPGKSSAVFPMTNSPIEYLKEYRKGLVDVRHKIHDAANKFVAPLCLREFAKPLYERAECLYKAIVDVNRQIKRYEMTEKFGTALHDLYRTNNADESKHDNFEAVENYGD